PHHNDREHLQHLNHTNEKPIHRSSTKKNTVPKSQPQPSAARGARLNAVTMTGATRSQTTPSQSVRGNASARPIALTDRSAARARFSRRADAPTRRPTQGGRRGPAVGGGRGPGA